MSQPPNGPPNKPPATNPNVAAATLTTAAPCSPAFSSSGAKPMAVPMPPASVKLPHTKPSKGDCPIIIASGTPTRFCATARTVEIARKINTQVLPFFTNDQLAFKPTQVKNAMRKGSLIFFDGALIHCGSIVTNQVHHCVVTPVSI